MTYSLVDQNRVCGNLNTPGFILNGLLSMTGHFAWTEPGVQCGLLAVTSLSLLSILSIRPLRGMHYEFFLFTHFIFAL